VFDAFSIGPFIIWTRLVFFLLGVALAADFFLRLAESAHLSLQHFREHALRYLAAFLLGGRLIAVVGAYRVYVRDLPRLFVFWDGGFSFLGGAIGIGFILYLSTRLSRATFLQWLDALVPAMLFGLAFDWFGQFAAGSAYGKPSDLPWAVTYDTIGVRYTIPIHPVQLYYALALLALTFLLLVIRKHGTRAGAQTLVGILSAAVLTFFFEYFRGDFTIPVFATKMDFVVLVLLFASLGVLAALELALSRRGLLVYEGTLIALFCGYLIARSRLGFATVELRFSQLLAVLSVLGTIVYVVAHRRRHPNL